ncbi:MAG: CPBP family intramembrane glutamic endopeptidase [Bacteroidota bacterium]
MFNRYWRVYPWFLQLFLFIMMIFILFYFFSIFTFILIPKITHIPVSVISTLNENSPRSYIQVGLLTQFITHASIFLLPSFVFAYLTHPRPVEYLGFRAPGKKIHWLLVSLAIIGATPVFIYLGGLFQSMHWGKWAEDSQKTIDNTEKAFFQMQSLGDFIKVFITLAIMPALGEEMLFRGVLMRFSFKRNKRITFPILMTAFMFALLHYSAYGFVSIFLAGVFLGYVYYLTGSLWCSVLAHLLNNGIQVIIIYLAKDNSTLQSVMDNNLLPIYIPLIGLALFTVSFYLLWQNKTPLPNTWADDYSAQELLDQENQ